MNIAYCSDACATVDWTQHWVLCEGKRERFSDDDDPQQRFSQWEEEGVHPSGKYSKREDRGAGFSDSEEEEEEKDEGPLMPPGWRLWRGIRIPPPDPNQVEDVDSDSEELSFESLARRDEEEARRIREEEDARRRGEYGYFRGVLFPTHTRRTSVTLPRVPEPEVPGTVLVPSSQKERRPRNWSDWLVPPEKGQEEPRRKLDFEQKSSSLPEEDVEDDNHDDDAYLLWAKAPDGEKGYYESGLDFLSSMDLSH